MIEEVLVFSSRCFSDIDTSVRNACDYMNLSADPVPLTLCNLTTFFYCTSSQFLQTGSDGGNTKSGKRISFKEKVFKGSKLLPKPENTWKCRTSTERDGTPVM